MDYLGLCQPDTSWEKSNSTEMAPDELQASLREKWECPFHCGFKHPWVVSTGTIKKAGISKW